MWKILKGSNKIILLMAAIMLLFFYRTGVRNLQDMEVDHVNLFLHLAMIIFLFMGLFSWRSKRIGNSSLCRIVLLFLFLIVLGSVFNWLSSSSFIQPVLWCVYFMVTFMFVQNDNDEILLKATITLVCFLTLYVGFLSMNMAGIISGTVGGTEEYKFYQNIIGCTMVTIPTVMTLKNQLLKWIIYIGVVLLAIVTARRMAIVCVAVIFIMNLFDTNKDRGKRKGISIVLLLGAVILTYNIVTSVFSSNLETSLDRLTMENIKDNEGSGRFELWSDVFQAIGNNNSWNWLFGHGTYGVLTVTYHTAAHNDFLEYFFDYGLVGLILFVSLHVCLIRRVIKLFKIKSDYRLSYFMSYFIFLLYGSFGNVLLYPEFCLPLVSYWGYMEAKFISNSQLYENEHIRITYLS